MEAIAEMTIGSLIGSGAGILALLCLIIEFSPIKLNPLAVLGRRINAETNAKVDKLQAEILKQRVLIDDNERDRIRFEILNFANSCRCKRRHSIEEFNHIFELYDKYHEILDRNHEINGKIDSDMEYIRMIYHKCQEENDFFAG